ncbi:hypothetical protein ACEPAF_8327 [Sanghuangporus sanghuang]
MPRARRVVEYITDGYTRREVEEIFIEPELFTGSEMQARRPQITRPVPHQPQKVQAPRRPQIADVPHRPQKAEVPHQPRKVQPPHRPLKAEAPHRPQKAEAPRQAQKIQAPRQPQKAQAPRLKPSPPQNPPKGVAMSGPSKPKPAPARCPAKNAGAVAAQGKRRAEPRGLEVRFNW